MHSFRLSVYDARLRLRGRWEHLVADSISSAVCTLKEYPLVRSIYIKFLVRSSKKILSWAYRLQSWLNRPLGVPIGLSIAGERGVYPGACITQKMSYDILLLARNLNLYWISLLLEVKGFNWYIWRLLCRDISARDINSQGGYARTLEIPVCEGPSDPEWMVCNRRGPRRCPQAGSWWHRANAGWWIWWPAGVRSPGIFALDSSRLDRVNADTPRRLCGFLGAHYGSTDLPEIMLLLHEAC